MKASLFILLFLAVICASAQHSDFNLGAYTPPQYEFQGLDAGFDLLHNFNHNFTKTEFNSSSFNYFNTNRITTFDAGGSGNLSWFRNSNSPSWQSSEKAILYGSFGVSGRDQEGQLRNRNRSGSGRISINTIHRYYFRPRWFIEFPVTAEYQVHLSNQLTENLDSAGSLTNSSRARYNVHNAIAGLPLSAGYGRIDDVTAAQMAWYIMNSLEAEKRAEGINDEDIYNLAREISLITQKRYLDYRKRKIAEMKLLDSFLRSAGKTRAHDAEYFTTLNDYWNFASLPARLSGYKLYAGISPVWNYELRHNIKDQIVPNDPLDKAQETFSTASLLFKAGYILEKPHGLHWQHSINWDISAGPAWTFYRMKLIEPVASTAGKVRNDKLSVGTNAGYTCGFFPNSRTKVSFGADISYIYLSVSRNFSVTASSDDVRSSELLIQPGISYYYYISERFRINGYAGGACYFTDQKTEMGNNETEHNYRFNWQHWLNLSLTYSIF